MAIIPNGSKVLNQAEIVDTDYGGSDYLKELSQWYTMADVIETVQAAGGGGLEGTRYVYVPADGTEQENGQQLLDAYATAVAKVPLNGDPVTIICAPGIYDLPQILEVNEANIRIVPLDGTKSIFIKTNRIIASAEPCYFEGIDLIENSLQFEVTKDDGSTFKNCTGGDRSFKYDGISYGTYIDCTAGGDSFGGGQDTGVARGVYINCIAKNYSFGPAYADGRFINCESGEQCFGGSPTVGGESYGYYENCVGGLLCFGLALSAGEYKNCIAGGDSFGGGNASGVYTNCTAKGNSFGVAFSSGTFIDCTAGDDSFGSVPVSSEISGTYIRCEAGNNSFGYISDGYFENCKAGSTSFGLLFCRGTYYYCQSGINSFGENGVAVDGQVRFCKTKGTFPAAISPGVVALSLNGDDTVA